MTTVAKLIERAHESARAKGFWESEDSDHEGLVVAQKLALISTEIMEFAFEAENGSEEEVVLEELADVVIRTFDLAGYLQFSFDPKVLTTRVRSHASAKQAAYWMFVLVADAVQRHRKGDEPRMRGVLELLILDVSDYAAYVSEDIYSLRRAIEQKMEKNATREHKHGAAY